MSHHASAYEAAAAAAEAWKRAHPVGDSVAREEGSGNVGASGGAAVAVAVAAAAAAGNADAMAAAAVEAENAAAAAEAAAFAEAENAAALVAAAAGAAVTLAGGEDEGDVANAAIGEGAGAIQGFCGRGKRSRRRSCRHQVVVPERSAHAGPECSRIAAAGISEDSLSH